MEHEVIWSGSDKHVYLCVPSVELRDLGYVKPAPPRPQRFRDLTSDRLRILKALEARDQWKVSELRAELEIDVATMGGLLKRLERSGLARRVCFGIVARDFKGRRGRTEAA